MGRLVDIEDVKALINGLESLPWEEEVDELVNTIPTAYNVEKVVEDLQKVSKIIEQNENSIKYAIEENMAVYIVKRGGVE